MFPDSNSVYCWTCSRAYDPVAIISEQEGISLRAACKYLEDNAGVRFMAVSKDGGKFWELVAKQEADPEDEEYWERREMVAYRWAIHATVADLLPADQIDWEGFDNAHLDTERLRSWRDSQLTTRVV